MATLLLSLVAGVPPNFILFFLIGYIAHRNIKPKTSHCRSNSVQLLRLLVPTIILLPDLQLITGLSTEIFLYLSL